jgi:thymidylate synthase (FAD)
MKLINQNAEFIKQESGIEGIYKIIELAGRTSYLSWDKMTDNSAKKFVDMLIKSKHMSCLEHGAVYLNIGNNLYDTEFEHDAYKWNLFIQRYRENPYSKLAHNTHINGASITTNLRVLQENNWMEDLKYLCEPTEFHEKRLSVKVITDIGVTREFNRHRTFSIVEQSTRYCNFSKDKFGNEITFIRPSWYQNDQQLNDEYGFTATEDFLNYLSRCENMYMQMIFNSKYSSQQARQVLPLCTKTEVVYTAFESDWRHFLDLRLFGKTGEPHPQIKQLAELIKKEFEKAGVWEGIMKYPSKYD